MTGPPDFDRLVTAWLDERAQPHAPADVLEAALARTARLHRRPAWRIPERWIPMRLSLALAVVPRAVLILLVLALTAVAFAVVVVASQPSRLPPAVGPAANGLLAYDSGGDIWVMNPDGTDPRQLTRGPARDVGPVWSPDGTRLAYWSWPPATGTDTEGTEFVAPNTEDGNGSLVVMDADGSDPRVLADELSVPLSDLEPAWDPDGSRVALAHRDAGADVIDLVPVEGGAMTRLANGESPRWSPDGSLIAYRDATYPPGVMVISPEGGEPRRATQATGSGGAFYFPSWSPDSRRLVYYTEEDGEHDVWVVDADGSDEHPVSTDPDDEYWPAWSPTGDRIAFSRVIGDPQNRPFFVVVDVDGSNEVVLGRDGDPNFSGASPIWSPDGRFLLGGVYTNDSGEYSGCAPFDPCTMLKLHVIDATGASPDLTIPIHGNFWNLSWQRVAP